MHKGSLYSTLSAILTISCFFDNSHSVCGVISHCGFDLRFPDDPWCWASLCVDHLSLGKIFRSSAMAPHSSTLAWKIPWTEEPGRLQSMGSLRVGHSWVTSLSLFTFMHWRRKWQLTPVFLPGESHGWGSLVGYRLWGRTESDMIEAT